MLYRYVTDCIGSALEAKSMVGALTGRVDARKQTSLIGTILA